ncbi:MAG: hypothetical protein A2Z99_21620 [Treponema sp. GWB1_62_6]|nr:MAG: hypothetical protein A2Z99_21620 [Treponema sp. GWB1_62_6]OHE75629.1 MAG: hypothetical protein A2413_11175 [Treponema sp. RIFOXYC1_FULL_61_9]HCM27557.1 hypothetical protein [Treponema sp.]
MPSRLIRRLGSRFDLGKIGVSLVPGKAMSITNIYAPFKRMERFSETWYIKYFISTSYENGGVNRL